MQWRRIITWFKMNLFRLLCLNTECNDFWSVDCGTLSREIVCDIMSSMIVFLLPLSIFVHQSIAVSWCCALCCCVFVLLSTELWFVCVWSLNPTPLTITDSPSVLTGIGQPAVWGFLSLGSTHCDRVFLLLEVHL